MARGQTCESGQQFKWRALLNSPPLLPDLLLWPHLRPLQVSKPCDFANAATAPDMTAARLEVAPGSLPAGSAVYTIGLRAAKGGRADTDSTAIRVLEGVAPTGVIRCADGGGCRLRMHAVRA